MHIEPAPELGPDEAGFYSLAEADLVSNENTVRRRFQQLDHGLELVSIEIRIGGFHTVYYVGETAGQLDVSQRASQVDRATELARLEHIEGRKSSRVAFQLFFWNPAHTVRELNLQH